MMFAYLSQVSNFIKRTHVSFAGHDTSEVLDILGRMNAQIIASYAMVGATFKAETDADHGHLNTLIEINKMPQGGWCYEERIRKEA